MLLIFAIFALLAIVASPLPLRSEHEYAVKESFSVPNNANETRPADKSLNLPFLIGLRRANEHLIERTLLDVSDPASPRYGQYLTAQQARDMARPSDQTIDLVRSWLEANDIRIDDADFSPAMDWISFNMTIGKAEDLLQTSYFSHTYGWGHAIRVSEWSLPLYLHDHIDVIQPTTSQISVMPYGRAPVPGVDYAIPSLSRRGSEVMMDATHVRELYESAEYHPRTSTKNRIGILNMGNQITMSSDVSQYLAEQRPDSLGAPLDFDVVKISTVQDAEHRSDEADLDAEIVFGISWPTKLTVFSVDSPHTDDPGCCGGLFYDCWESQLVLYSNYLSGQDEIPQVISHSYGAREADIPPSTARRICSAFAQLGTRGTSMIFASGDNGVNSGQCVSSRYWYTKTYDPDFPSTCPWVTAIGATELSGTEEIATTAFGSGAGFSNYFRIPDYQRQDVESYKRGLDTYHDGKYNATGRAYPDVAALGENIATIHDGELSPGGGTSASAPVFGAVIALVNDALLAEDKPPLGFLNPWLYSTARLALNDIHNGSSFGCDGDSNHTTNERGFPASAGWDAVTGLGTPNFPRLLNAAFKAHANAEQVRAKSREGR